MLFEQKIKKAMGVCLYNSDSNVVNINALNTIIPNAMEKSKFGEASLYENDFLVPELWRIFLF